MRSADAWFCLTAAVMVTERIRLGTMLNTLPRMRTWKLSSEAATLDNLFGVKMETLSAITRTEFLTRLRQERLHH